MIFEPIMQKETDIPEPEIQLSETNPNSNGHQKENEVPHDVFVNEAPNPPKQNKYELQYKPM